MTDTKRPQITGRVNGSLRDRIAYAIAQADGDLPGMEPDSWDYELADAVIRDVLTPEFLADLVIEAIQKAADDA